MLGRKRCSCEQINNITGYFRKDEQLPRRLNNVVRNFAHLRILLVTSLVYQPRHSRDTNVFHSATFALQRCCFVPREWLAVKGLFCMVAHNCHSKTRNLTAKTKYLTAKPKTSRQKQNTSRQNRNPHGKNKIPHGKTKYITAKAKELWFCCGYLLLPLFGCRNRVGL